jgi:hypothetical protein
VAETSGGRYARRRRALSRVRESRGRMA